MFSYLWQGIMGSSKPEQPEAADPDQALADAIK